jgi:hypothetical protein
MGANLLIERVPGNVSAPISLDEWKRLVTADPDLRLRTEPWMAVNPRTADRITIPLGEADSEMWCDHDWLPFLWFARGRLAISYREEFDDSTNLVRLKIAEVARKLNAVVSCDCGGEPVQW